MTDYAPLAPTPSSPIHRRSSLSPRHSEESTVSLDALEASEGPSNSDSRKPQTRHGRSNSSMSFSQFGTDALGIIPLSLSVSESEGRGNAVAERTVGLFSGVALVVGSQVGSGIFSSPGVVVANVQSVGAALVVWLVAGILAWTGASSFAELGSMIPLNGGAQAYLAYAYGPLISYLYTWTAISLLKPGSAAIISLIFGEYLCRVMFHATNTDALPNAIPDWAIKLTASLAIVVITLINIASTRLGSRANLLFTTIKVAALIAITILGLIQLIRGRESSSLREPLFSGTSSNPSSFALALYSGLWAYDSWDQANNVAGELKNAEKNLPRVIHISMGVVVTAFVLTNVSYFALLDKSIVGLSNTIALDFGRALFGSIGAILFAVMVAVSCFGALTAGFFSSARLISVAGREGYLPALFGALHPTRKTPINAMLLQASLTFIFILFGGGFRTLINVFSVAEWGFYFLTVAGLLVLRVKEPALERPYKTWIITPLTFSAVALFLLLMPVVAAPMEALAAVGFIFTGVPLYYITRRHHSASGGNSVRTRRASNEEDGLFSRISASLRGMVARIRGGAPAVGRSSRAAVFDEEETVEMLESRDRA